MSCTKATGIARIALAAILTLAATAQSRATAQEPADTIEIQALGDDGELAPAPRPGAKPDTAARVKPLNRRDRIQVDEPDDDGSPAAATITVVDLSGDTIEIANLDTIPMLANAQLIAAADSTAADSTAAFQGLRPREYNPDPIRAVWLSALFPGLGQIYNRKFWKLPIVVGGYVGLIYATSWNNGMLKDYTKAYSDAMDNDPNTNSYMDFYPSTTKEEDINMTWLKKVLKSKKDFYRRYRDLCIICMVGAYFVCMVDAYVDASLAHFDIAPDLTFQIGPTFIEQSLGQLPAVGLQCAITF